MIELTSAQRVSLRARAQALQPVVSVAGNGLTPAVLNEIDRSLKAHELIKIRTYGIERRQRDTLMNEICTSLHCTPVQHIGNLLVVFRERPAQSQDTSTQARAPAGRQTKKQLAAAMTSAKPGPRRRTNQPSAAPVAPQRQAAPAAPRRRATPNPPRRANTVRGR